MVVHTENLLRLVNEFSDAFADPEAGEQLHPELEGTSQAQHPNAAPDTKIQVQTLHVMSLLQLIEQFPAAFADPERFSEVQPEDDLASGTRSTPQVTTTASLPESTTESHTPSTKGSVPAGYAQALHRRVTTFAWGQVDFHLAYGKDGLEEIWSAIGKSGTEVQSLSEAICRLINLLLAKGMPIPQIVREIRGIRGADSEGLGPNRILGLADLIGKVLQEAPVQYGTAQIAESPLEYQITDNGTSKLPQTEGIVTSTLQPGAPEASTTSPGSQEASSELFFFSTTTEANTLCPECGAELQQVTGCKGGACVVCGYSSCS